MVQKNDGVYFILLILKLLNNLALRVKKDVYFNLVLYPLLQILLLDLFLVNHFKSKLFVGYNLISGFDTVHISSGTSA